MVTTGDVQSQRARYTRVAAEFLNASKLPDEAVGVAVERARPAGWRVVVRAGGDVAVSADCGLDPGDDVIRAVLAGALADARTQAAFGDQVKSRRSAG